MPRSAAGLLIVLSFAWTAPAPEPSGRVASAQEASPLPDIARLVDALVGAASDSERADLLAEHASLVSTDLRTALNGRGTALRNDGDHAASLAAHEAELQVARLLEDPAGQAQAYQGIATTLYARGDVRQALEPFERALDVSRRHGLTAREAEALIGIGDVFRGAGEYARALPPYERALALGESLGDRSVTARVLNGLGVTYRMVGSYDRALEAYERSLAISQASGNRAVSARTFNNIGIVHAIRGNLGLAMRFFRQSLEAREELGDRAGVTQSLHNIGNVHLVQHNYVLALEIFRRTLALRRELDDRTGSALTLNSIGYAHLQLGELDEAALAFERSLDISDALEDRAQSADTMLNLGDVALRRDQPEEAARWYERSLALNEALGIRAQLVQTLYALARLDERLGRPREALAHADRAHAIATELRARSELWRIELLAGRLHRVLGDQSSAEAAFRSAIDVVESLRLDTAGAAQDRQRFFERMVTPYTEMVALLAGQERLDEAFGFAERAKARVLLDVMEGGPRVTSAMTPDERQRERDLRTALVSLRLQLDRAAASNAGQEEIDRIEEALARARVDYEAFQTSLYASHPELRVRRADPAAVAPADIAALLRPGELALEFVTGERGTYLFVVGASSGDDEPEPLMVQRLEPSAAELSELVGGFRSALAQRSLGFQPRARALFDALLAPVRERLEAASHVIIVPDGPLWNVPFQALQPSAGRFLVQDVTIGYAPSLAVLRALRNTAPGSRPHDERLLAVGNPRPAGVRASILGSAPGPSPYPALPEAETQVAALERLYGEAISTVFVGPEAQEDRIKREAGRHRIVQLATHGILDDINPMYSHLVLAEPDPESREDGLLEAWEMMELELEQTDLVILAACETAAGRVGRGEGLIGMSWALFVGGARTSVVSQWKVDAGATNELMLEFHRRLKVRGDGPAGAAAEALRDAALSLLESPRYRHPFYWAAFVAIG